jgi:glycosyltransferase involved in cell wall biosynthesis
MRILQLGRFYPPHVGGIESVIYEITEGLNASNIVCDVLCSNKANRLEITDHGKYRVTRTASVANILSTSISPAQVSELKKKANDYDVIHLHHPDPMATLALLSCYNGQKIVIHWHSDIIRQKVAFFFYRPLQEMLLRRSDAIIVTSPNYLESSLHLRDYKEKTQVVPIGIKVDFHPNDRKIRELTERYKGKTVIFSLGRHVYYKGFEYLIDAATFLSDDFVIIIGGDGPLTPSLRKRIAEKKLDKKVVMTGTIPDSEVSSYFEVCDIFCLPSIERSEAFGVVLVEAMSFGKPLVATNIPGSGVSWVNEHNQTGLNVAPENAEELAEAFLRISENRFLQNKFSRKSRSEYQEKFTREKMIQRLIALYGNL